MVLDLIDLNKNRQALEDINFYVDVEIPAARIREKQNLSFFEYFRASKQRLDTLYERFLKDVRNNARRKTLISFVQLEDAMDLTPFEDFSDRIISSQKAVYKAISTGMALSQEYEALQEQAGASSFSGEGDDRTLAIKEQIDYFNRLLKRRAPLVRGASNDFIGFLEFLFLLRMNIYAKSYEQRYYEGDFKDDLEQAEIVFNNFRLYSIKEEPHEKKPFTKVENALLLGYRPEERKAFHDKLIEAVEVHLKPEKRKINSYEFPKFPFHKDVKLGFTFTKASKQRREMFLSVDRNLAEMFNFTKKFAFEYRGCVIESVEEIVRGLG